MDTDLISIERRRKIIGTEHIWDTFDFLYFYNTFNGLFGLYYNFYNYLDFADSNNCYFQYKTPFYCD